MKFTELKNFIENKMRMSHIYQPLMIRCLLQNRGVCSQTEIARLLLLGDRGQIEYCENATRNTVGRVLTSHKIVRREGRVYQLEGYEKLSRKEKDELLRIFDDKLDAFIEARGDKIWNQRQKSASYIPGSLR